MHKMSLRQTDEDDENAAASGTTLSCRDSVRQERSLLFQPSSAAGRSALEGGKRGRTSLPSEAELFQTFDVAFGCAYFGNV